MNSRNNYFIKLIKYIKNVYHIDKEIIQITDKRKNPTYKTSQIISLVLGAISAQTPKINYIRHLAVPFSMHQIRSYFMILHTNIIFNIISEKGRID